MPKNIRTKLAIFGAIALASFVARPQAMDYLCLTPAQIEELQQRQKKARELFKLDEIFEDVRAKERAREGLLGPATECAGKYSNPVSSMMADLEGCKSKIRSYNNANTLYNIATKRLQQEQEALLRQLQIERSMFPACR